MTYSKYTNMPTKELLALILNAPEIDELSMELVARIIMAEEELGYPSNDEEEDEGDYPEAA